MTTATMTRAQFLETVAPGANCSRGAPMGRGDWPAATLTDGRRKWPGPGEVEALAALASIPRKFYLRELPIDSGGYDPGGAYWGLSFDGSRLYAAVAPSILAEIDGDKVELDWARFYVRALSRDHAKREIVARYPGARFFDGERGPIVPNGRYSITLEWTGAPSPLWVVRLYGDRLGPGNAGHAETLEGAETLAERHAAAWRERIARGA